MTVELDLLRAALEQVADFSFAWSGQTRELHKMAVKALDDEERVSCGWASDFQRFLALLKRWGSGNAVSQLYDSDRRVFIVSRDHVGRPPIDPYPRVDAGTASKRCPYCGIRIDHSAVDIPTAKTPEGYFIHEVCRDLWRTLPKAKRDARPAGAELLRRAK